MPMNFLKTLMLSYLWDILEHKLLDTKDLHKNTFQIWDSHTVAEIPQLCTPYHHHILDRRSLHQVGVGVLNFRLEQ